MRSSMFKYLFLLMVSFFNLTKGYTQQRIYTILHIDGYSIHFNIIKGKGIPIVFENGANGDLTIWDSILKPVSSITGATLITYDQIGLGKSSR
jgi:hypothetical protein